MMQIILRKSSHRLYALQFITPKIVRKWNRLLESKYDGLGRNGEMKHFAVYPVVRHNSRWTDYKAKNVKKICVYFFSASDSGAL